MPQPVPRIAAAHEHDGYALPVSDPGQGPCGTDLLDGQLAQSCPLRGTLKRASRCRQ